MPLRRMSRTSGSSRATGRRLSAAMTWSNVPCHLSVPVAISLARARSRSSGKPRAGARQRVRQVGVAGRDRPQHVVRRFARGRNHPRSTFVPGATWRPGEELARGHRRAGPRAGCSSRRSTWPSPATTSNRSGSARTIVPGASGLTAGVSAVRWMRMRAPAEAGGDERPRLQPAHEVVNALGRQRPVDRALGLGDLGRVGGERRVLGRLDRRARRRSPRAPRGGGRRPSSARARSTSTLVSSAPIGAPRPS